MIIVKRGIAASSFGLSTGEVITLQPEPLLNIISDEIFELLMKEWGSFITPRILSDENPKGCFIIQGKKESAESQAKEFKEEEIPAAMPIDGDALHEEQERAEKVLEDIEKEKKLTTPKKKKNARK